MTRDELVKRISESQTMPFVCSEKLADLLLKLTGTAVKTAAPPEPKRTRGQIAAAEWFRRYMPNEADADDLAALIDAERADAEAAAREQCAVECENIRRAQTTGAAIDAANACAVRIRSWKDGGT